jgi:N,N'-diacetyllegionaminate synthase
MIMAGTNQIRIGKHKVGAGAPCFIMAEVGQAHDGSLGNAHAFIDAAADAGCDAIKFQTHIAAAESMPGEPWRVKFSYEDKTRYGYWRRMEFSAEQWHGLKRHADKRGLVFLSSAFSLEAADLLDKIGMAAWKVASGEIVNKPLIERMAVTRRPVLLSTGMSGHGEIGRAVSWVRKRRCTVALFQATSVYPVPPEQIGLNVIGELRGRHHCPVGLSDHSGSALAALAATALGLDLLEVHVTWSQRMFGPDSRSSLTFEDLAKLVRDLRGIEAMLRHPVDKDATARKLRPMRRLFMKSLVARNDLPVGTVLQPRHLTAKKPGTGIPVERIEEIYGRRTRRLVKGQTMIRAGDLSPKLSSRKS